MPVAGYSHTPLAKKLGLKDGFRVRLVNTPANYPKLFTDMPRIILADDTTTPKNFIHYFVSEAKQLLTDLPLLKMEIEMNGMIWVSWPKKASKVKTDISEDTIRNIALRIGLVDVKVCAIDETWSGLKLVIPLRNRK